MLSIRLMRTGKVHDPHYRIVVQEKRSKLNGKAVDTVGHYHPAQADKKLVVDAEKTQSWLSKGAQPSDTVTNLLVKAGVLDASRKIKTFYTPKPKEDKAEKAPVVEETATEEVATEAVAEVATTEETVAEEVPVIEEAPVEETVAEEVPTTEEVVEEAAPETTPEAPVAEEVVPEAK